MKTQQQQGMTLIELMISLVLSLGLIAGISSLFLQMQKSNKVQRALSTMADESSYVQEVLQKEIRRTGGLRSRSDVNGTPERIFKGGGQHLALLGSAMDFRVTEYIKGDATVDPALPGNDSLILRYQLLDTQDLSFNDPSNGSSPCTQNVLLDADENPAMEKYVVSVHLFLQSGQLKCAAQRERIEITALETDPTMCVKNCTTPDSTAAAAFVPVDAPVNLVSNVVKLSIRYGVDTDNDNAADYYVDAATVPAGTPAGAEPDSLWNNVVSLRLSLVLRSQEDHLGDTIVPYYLDGVAHTPSDHRLYKAFTTTIALRNILLGA